MPKPLWRRCSVKPRAVHKPCIFFSLSHAHAILVLFMIAVSVDGSWSGRCDGR